MFDRKEYMEEWRRNNPEKIREYKKQWRKNNPEYIKEYHKQYYKNHEEYIKKYNKQYCKDNYEYIKERKKQWQKKNPEYMKKYRKDNAEHHKQYMKHRRKIDLKININHNISGAIYKSIKGNKVGRHWEDLVGYTLSDLIRRLKKTMPKGYNWDNFLRGELHIDHIIPKSVFDFDSSNQINFQKCWSLKNLQLLPAKENRIKHDKLYKPFQPALKI